MKEYSTEHGYFSALSIYYIGREQCEKGHAFGPAIRTHYLMHFIYHGKGYYYRNNKKYEVKEGEAFLILPGETTYYEADWDDPWEYAWVAFDGYESKGILKSCGLSDDNLIFRSNESERLLHAVTNLVEAYPSSAHSRYKLLSCLFTVFSCMETSTLIPLSYDKMHLSKALQYMQNNYSYDIKISDIANYIGIDRTYLYKIFKRVEHISPIQYLLNYRLYEAMKLLEKSNSGITEIALSCGFKDSSSFCKHFKKKTGLTPSQYRISEGHSAFKNTQISLPSPIDD